MFDPDFVNNLPPGTTAARIKAEEEEQNSRDLGHGAWDMLMDVVELVYAAGAAIFFIRGFWTGDFTSLFALIAVGVFLRLASPREMARMHWRYQMCMLGRMERARRAASRNAKRERA